MSEWKLVDVEGIGSGYACLTLDGVSTTKSRNLIQADRGAGGDGLGFSDLGTLLIDYADRDIAGVVGITGDQGGIREDVVGRSDVHIISGVLQCPSNRYKGRHFQSLLSVHSEEQQVQMQQRRGQP